MLFSRRAVLLWAAGGQPVVRHILPAASHNRFCLKVSFHAAHSRAPVLRVGARRVNGERTDALGENWVFHVASLKPATEYELQLLDGAAGKSLFGPWPLRTLPHPDESVPRFR